LKSPYAQAVLALALWLQTAHAETPAVTRTGMAPDGYLRRLEAALLLQTLNADLLSHDSATLTLERWCDVHHLASPARITAERVRTAEQPPTETQRQQLRVTLTDPIRYRREADNWYVPARLTPEMNRLLETTDTPFGAVVRSLQFQRHTISSEVLWQFLPSGWEMEPPSATDGASTLCFPAQVLEHRALLTLPDGTPISEVVETYTSNVLAIARLGPAPAC